MVRRNTRKQHYVQQALLKLWAEDGFVDTVRKKPEGTLVKGKRKTPGAIFYDLYTYEQFYGFESAKKHLNSSMSVSTDSNHIFYMNDGELYCKRIEDRGFPIIKEIIANVNNDKDTMNLSSESKESLCKYLVLQTLRTPTGRRNYQIDYIPRIITSESTDEETIDGYISNMTYLFNIGVYDDIGLADGYEMPESPFQHLLGIIKDMNGYALHLRNSKKNCIMGDNPCVLLGKGRGVSGAIMPLTPEVILLLIAEEECEELNKIEICACPEKWIQFEHYCEIETSHQMIIYNGKKLSVEEINKSYINNTGNINNLEIWTAKKMMEYLG